MDCNSDICYSSPEATNSKEDTGNMTSVLPSESVQPEKTPKITIIIEANRKEEASPTANKTPKSEKKGVRRFFQTVWKAIKRPFRRKKPDEEANDHTPKADTDLVDPTVKDGAVPESKTEADGKPKTSTDPASPKSPDTIPRTNLITFIKQRNKKKNEVSVLNDYMYFKKQKLGKGRFARVYKGIRKSDSEEVAIKIVKKKHVKNFLTIPGSSSPVPAEVALLLKMHEPSTYYKVIQLYDWGEDPKSTILVMEYPQSFMTMSSLIYRVGVLREKTAHHLWVQLVRAVLHCLKRGIFNSDIHPNNILVNPESLELKLIDFGACMQLEKSGYKSKDYLGDVDYRPPEVTEMRRYYALPVTVWLLGSVLYEMVHGRSAYCIYDVEPELLIYSKLSEELQELILGCLNDSIFERLRIDDILTDPWFVDEKISAAAYSKHHVF